MFEMIKTFFIGIFVGIANVIPGVSGGTLIAVFNIYDKFVNIITFNVKKLIKNWKFVVPILLGMATGIVFFSKVITKLYVNFPFQTNSFFLGLILGSFPFLYNYIQPEKQTFSAVASNTLCMIFGIALIIGFYILNIFYGTSMEASNVILPELSTPLAVKLFIGGILGAVAMIVPGISGSLIMLIMGIYPIIISAIPAMLAKDTMIHAVLLLLPNGFGIIFGLLAGAKLLSWLLEKFKTQTYSVIFGLILGSAVTMMIPIREDLHSFKDVIIMILCVIPGFCMAYFSSKFGGEENSTKAENTEAQTADKK